MVRAVRSTRHPTQSLGRWLAESNTFLTAFGSQIIVAFFAVIVGMPGTGRAAETPLNVVIVLIDDMGWADLLLRQPRVAAGPRGPVIIALGNDSNGCYEQALCRLFAVTINRLSWARMVAPVSDILVCNGDYAATLEKLLAERNGPCEIES